MALEEAQNGGADQKEATKTAVAAVTFTAVKPQLFVEAPKANDAVQFYKNAFGAEEVTRVNQKRKAEQEIPLLSSVELKLGSSSFLVSDLTDDVSSAPYVFLIFYLFFAYFCMLSTWFLMFVSKNLPIC